MSNAQGSKRINELFIYVAIIISLVVFTIASFPQSGIEVTQNQIFLLVVVLVLPLFRHFSKIEIPGFLKLSKDIEEVRKETREIRSAIQSIAISKSISSAVVNIHQMIDNQAQEAREIEPEIPSVPSDAVIDDQLRTDEANIRQLVDQSQFVAAFAILRNRLETTLREIVYLGGGEEKRRFSLFQLTRATKKMGILDPSIFDAIIIVNNTANTILHSHPYEETIPLEKARYISELGIKTLYELQRVRNQLSSR